MDDVLTASRDFASHQVVATFKSDNHDSWPELWSKLILDEARANLATLHSEFWPQYVVSSSWSNYLTRKEFQEVFRHTGMEFVANNMHKHWTTPKGIGPGRLTEIESWIAKHLQARQPMLILDDHDSGWSLHESHLDQKGLVVLCQPWVGFVGDNLLDAQRLLRLQIVITS
jgi:hypothetical protein